MAEKQKSDQGQIEQECQCTDQNVMMGALLSGRDVLGILSPAYGRSLSWTLPVLSLTGITLIITSITNALVQRADALRASGIRAACLNQDLPEDNYQALLTKVRAGEFQLIYAPPEAVGGPELTELACIVPIDVIAVNEAQCISRWSEEFRPDYLPIATLIRLLPKRPVVAAFAPEASPEVREDICRLLLHNPLCLVPEPDFSGLALDVAAPRRRDSWLLEFLSAHSGQSGLICCGSSTTAQALCALCEKNDIPASPVSDQSPARSAPSQVLVAESPLAGLTLPEDLGFLIHYDLPPSLEAYAHDISCARRPGGTVDCTLLFSPADAQELRKDITLTGTDQEQQRRQRQLDHLVDYCKTGSCLQLALLRHLGQETDQHCGRCGNCTSKYVRQDITREARLILTALGHIEDKFPFGLGRPLIVLVLQGDSDRRITRMGLDQLPDYGILSDLSRPQLRAYIDALIREGCLYVTQGEFPVLRRTDMGIRALEQGDSFHYQVRMKQGKKKRALPLLNPEDEKLVLHLRQLRTDIAREASLPAYVIFSNAILMDMAQQKPQTREELLAISGIGQVKADRYGDRFLNCIRDWLENR